MSAHPPRTTSSYNYDSAHASLQGKGAAICGYDWFANYVTGINLEIWPGTAEGFRQFTGKERDSESGLDYFGARYYGSALGRFTSPDSPFADQHTGNPQSWNLYAYGRNNPLRFTDDDGEKVKEATHVVYYDVHGSTAAEAQQNAKQTSGLGEGSDPMMGLTTTRTSIDMSSLKISETNDGFEGVAVTDTMTVTAGDVKLDITTTLPRWVEQGQASPEEGAAWDKSQQSLQAQEDGHKAIAEQGAAALDKSLPGTKGVGIAPTSGDAAAAASKKLSGALTAKVKANGAQTHQKQIDYDARTDHGRKQTQ